MKPRTPTLAFDALIGDGEQTGKKRENKERNWGRISNITTLDPSVASYDPQEPYGEPILLTPGPQKGIFYLFIYETPPPLTTAGSARIMP